MNGTDFERHTQAQAQMQVGPGQDHDIFDEFESYRFSDDPEFRAGLPTVIAAIRGQDRSADQIDEMIGRAQWFYFTKIRGVSIPWEDYARRQATTPYVDPASPTTGLVLSRTGSRSPSTPTAKLPRSPREALQTLNNLAEARMMMKDATQGDSGAEEGLSFSMLSRLISEGRTGEVPVKQIPEGTNDVKPSQAQLQARPKPWELPQPLHSSPTRPHFDQTTPTAPTFLQHRSYPSSFHNSPHIYDHPGPSRRSFDGGYHHNSLPQIPQAGPSHSYDPSPNWASSGPTISPDLSFESFRLDPDLSFVNTGSIPNLTMNSSSGSTNASIHSGIPDASNSTTSSIPYNTTQTSFDETSFSNYLNMDYDSNNNHNPNNQNRFAPPAASPGEFQTSSSSTPAPGPNPATHPEWPTTNNTPSSSHSL